MSLPDILDIQPLNHPYDMTVETDILYPIHFSQTQAKFVFDNKGVLDRNSRLSIQLLSKRTGDEKHTDDARTTDLPAFMGGNSGASFTLGGALTGPNTSGSTTTLQLSAADWNTATAVAMPKIGDFINTTGGTGTGQNLVITAVDGDTRTLTFATATALAADTDFTLYSSTVVKCNANLPVTTEDIEHLKLLELTIDNAAGTAMTFKITAVDGPTQTIIITPPLTARTIANNTAFDNAKLYSGVRLDAGASNGTGDNVDYYAGWKLTTDVGGNNEKSNMVKSYGTVLGQTQICLLGKDLALADWTAVNGNEFNVELGAEDNPAFLPIATGISALIRRAYLEIGGRRVSTLEELGHYNTFKKLSQSVEYRTNVMSAQEGGHNQFYGSANVANTEKGLIGLVSDTVPKFQKLGSTSTTSGQFSLALADIIPMLRGLQLPLFLINQEVSLHLEFQPDVSSKRCIQQNHGLDYSGTTINQSNFFICADYLYYPTQMEQMRQEIYGAGGFNLPYEDIFTIQSQIPSVASPGGTTPNDWKREEVNRDLALGGKKVRAIILQKEGTANNLMGVYHSTAFQRGERYNWNIDSVPFYSIDITNEGLKYNECSKVFGTPLQIPQSVYTLADAVDENQDLEFGADSFITDKELEGTETGLTALEQNKMSGQQNWVGLEIGNKDGEGRVLSNMPLEYRAVIERKLNTAIAEKEVAPPEYSINFTYRFFVLTQKLLNIKNGFVSSMG